MPAAEAAAEYIGFRRDTWSNAKHAAQWRSTLATYAGASDRRYARGPNH